MRALERIYRRRVPLEHITSRELATSLCEASSETGRQVGALVHRSGQVDYVIVGDASRLHLPDVGRLRAAQGRFRGLRLIHTHLNNEPLSRDDIVDLVRLRLDLVAAVFVGENSEPGQIMVAHNAPQFREGDAAYQEIGPLRLDKLQINFGTLITNLETEFARLAQTREIHGKDGRAILVHVVEKYTTKQVKNSTLIVARTAAESSMRELNELARTAGVEVVDSLIQYRDKMDPKYVLGRGKLDDLVIRAMQLDAECLIFDCELSPSQATSIAALTDLKILDRTQLILDIFAQQAKTRDGKIQVELAQLKYALPRLNQKDDALSRLTGGIGGRGPGETKLEIGKRRAKERVHHLEAQVKELARQRKQRRSQRARQDTPVVAVVGYTNAGKSTLLNTMTGASVVAENKLFATLDTRARKLFVPTQFDAEGNVMSGRPVVMVDTVGFVRDLPDDLFDAFRATFEEAADADVLIQVVDASDSALADHLRATDHVLSLLSLDERKRILVLNKCDLLTPGERERLKLAYPHAIQISASEKNSTREVLHALAEALPQHNSSDRVENSAESKPENKSEEFNDETPFIIDGAIISMTPSVQTQSAY